jgi:hypothetical protein
VVPTAIAVDVVRRRRDRQDGAYRLDPVLTSVLSMRETITWVGGRAPPVQKRRSSSQNLVGSLQLAVLALELL